MSLPQVIRNPAGVTGSGSYQDLGPTSFIAVPVGMVRTCTVRGVVGSGTADLAATLKIVDTNAVVADIIRLNAFPVRYGTPDGAPDLEFSLMLTAGFKIQVLGLNVAFSMVNCVDDDATA